MVSKEAAPISTTELLTKYHDEELDPESLRRAVWNLRGEAKLDYIEDPRLVLAAAADPAQDGLIAPKGRFDRQLIPHLPLYSSIRARRP
jgi:hypothetical protein